MNLNAESKAYLRKALLRAAHSASPASLNLDTFKDVSQNAGFQELTFTDLLREVAYCTDKGWFSPMKNPFSAGQKRWKITAEGVDAIEELG